MKNQKLFLEPWHWFKVITLGVVIGLSLQFARAWTEPTEAPPGGNLGAPLNTGTMEQSKSAGLNLYGADHGIYGEGSNYGVYGYETDTGVGGILGKDGWGVYSNGPMGASSDLHTNGQLVVHKPTWLCTDNENGCWVAMSDDAAFYDPNDYNLWLWMRYGGNLNVNGGDVCTNKDGSWECLSNFQPGYNECSCVLSTTEYAVPSTTFWSCSTRLYRVCPGGQWAEIYENSPTSPGMMNYCSPGRVSFQCGL